MTRSLLLFVLKLAVIAGAVYYLVIFQRVNFGQLRIDQDGWPWLALAASLIAAQMVLLQFRLFVFLGAAGIAIPFSRVVRAGLISWFINATMLGGLGALSADAVRAGYLVRETKKRTSLFSILFFDRAMGLTALVTLVCAMLATGIVTGGFTGRIGALWIEIFYVLLCLACAVAAIVVHEKTGSMTAIALAAGASLTLGVLIFFLAGRPAGLPWIMLAVLAATLAALAILRFRAATDLSSSALRGAQAVIAEALATFLALRGKAAALLAGYACSLASNVLSILAIYLLGHAILIEPEPTLLQTLIAAPVAFLTGVLPLPANGIGVGEVAFDAMLAIQRPPGAATLAGATLYLAFRIVSALTAVIGAPFFLINRIGKRGNQTPDDTPR